MPDKEEVARLLADVHGEAERGIVEVTPDECVRL
jgi:hypothetical protein